MKSIWTRRRKSRKKLVTLPLDFTGALLAVTEKSGVVLLTLKNGKVESYMTDIDDGNEDLKYYIKKAEKKLKNSNMSDLNLYVWENVGDNFEKLMFVYGGELNPRMSCVE